MDRNILRLYPQKSGLQEGAVSSPLSQPYSPRFVLYSLCSITIRSYKSTYECRPSIVTKGVIPYPIPQNSNISLQRSNLTRFHVQAHPSHAASAPPGSSPASCAAFCLNGPSLSPAQSPSPPQSRGSTVRSSADAGPPARVP